MINKGTTSTSDGTRTHNPRLRRPMPFPLSHLGVVRFSFAINLIHFVQLYMIARLLINKAQPAPQMGLEPTIPGLGGRCLIH